LVISTDKRKWRFFSIQCSTIFESALVFGKFLGSSRVSAPCTNVEHWWTENERKSKYSEKTPSQRHFVVQKSRMIWLGIEPALCDENPATNHRNQGTKIFKTVYKDLVPTAWWTYYVSITKVCRLMLYNEVFLSIPRISCETQQMHSEARMSLLNAKAYEVYSNHSAWKNLRFCYWSPRTFVTVFIKPSTGLWATWIQLYRHSLFM
jgi:hypothetical protein